MITSSVRDGRRMRLVGLAAVTAGLMSAAAAPATAATLAGSWSQRSDRQELVLVPQIKLAPNVGVSMGTSLGGSVGYGSMTRTTVVTQPTLLAVGREMSLQVGSDGGFAWTSVTRHADGANCTRTTRRKKTGHVRLAGNTAVFTVAGGTEAYEKSCGGSGSSAIAPTTERYTVALTQSRMELADGATTWVFTRR